jgi:integrase
MAVLSAAMASPVGCGQRRSNAHGRRSTRMVGRSRSCGPRIHGLRHTAASWMLQVGFSLPVVQDRMGQESITTTVAVYGHLDRRSMQAAADATALALAGI